MAEGMLIPLSSLLQRSASEETSIEGEEDDVTTAILSDAKADAARLRELLDAEEHSEPDEASILDAPSLDDLLRMCGPGPEAPGDGHAPSLDELLQMCERDDDDDLIDRLTGFICPECLMVASSQQALHEHYADAHAYLWATWKRSAGRRTGGEAYAFGDATRCLARTLRRASTRTKQRLVRRLRRARADPPRPGWLTVGAGALGVAVAALGAPVTGVAVAAAAAAAGFCKRIKRTGNKENDSLAEQCDYPGAEAICCDDSSTDFGSTVVIVAPNPGQLPHQLHVPQPTLLEVPGCEDALDSLQFDSNSAELVDMFAPS